ncbi:MAG: transcription elongation factor GreA [Fimbriimonadaceae bacterium]|nr:transcription elongation factor GreA [Fimbriimonadaceae bacterium]
MSDLNEAKRAVETDSDSSSTIFLLPEGYKRLRDELEHLTLTRRPEIADRIRESLQHGEFSEDNSELDEVKFDQAIVESRIQELKTIFGNAQELSTSDIPTSYVGIGSRVSLNDEAFGEKFTVRVVTIYEADPNADLISNESPLGVALMGSRPGDKIEFEAPDGPRAYSVISISR